jgi:hypothetical protein
MIQHFKLNFLFSIEVSQDNHSDRRKRRLIRLKSCRKQRKSMTVFTRTETVRLLSNNDKSHRQRPRLVSEMQHYPKFMVIFSSFY